MASSEYSLSPPSPWMDGWMDGRGKREDDEIKNKLCIGPVILIRCYLKFNVMNVGLVEARGCVCDIKEGGRDILCVVIMYDDNDENDDDATTRSDSYEYSSDDDDDSSFTESEEETLSSDMTLSEESDKKLAQFREYRENWNALVECGGIGMTCVQCQKSDVSLVQLVTFRAFCSAECELAHSDVLYPLNGKSGGGGKKKAPPKKKKKEKKPKGGGNKGKKSKGGGGKSKGTKEKKPKGGGNKSKGTKNKKEKKPKGTKNKKDKKPKEKKEKKPKKKTSKGLSIKNPLKGAKLPKKSSGGGGGATDSGASAVRDAANGVANSRQ